MRFLVLLSFVQVCPLALRLIKVEIFWHEKSFLNAEFLDSGVFSCPKPYLSLIRMENIFLGFFGHFFHDEVSVINYKKTSIS